MAKKKTGKEYSEDLRQTLVEYSMLMEYLNLPEEQRAETPMPDVNWERLIEYANDILGLIKDPAKMYPEIDLFDEVDQDDPQKLLFILEKKAMHCKEHSEFIRARSICNYLGFLVHVGRIVGRDSTRFRGIELALSLHELSFIAQSIHQTLFQIPLAREIVTVIEALPQAMLKDVVNIIIQIAATGKLVAQVGAPAPVQAPANKPQKKPLPEKPPAPKKRGRKPSLPI